MIPQQRPGQSFDEHQADMAQWMGCDIHTMNAAHDAFHRSLCAWLGVTSYAMREASGLMLVRNQKHLALLEEQAVLTTQRLAIAHGVGVPDLRTKRESAKGKAG